MINLTLMHFDGQAYELTDRYTAPQSSSGCLYRDDPYSTFQLIASLSLQPHDWFSILRRASASPIKFGSNHPGEIYQTVTDALMRGDLRLYRLPRVDGLIACVAKATSVCALSPAPNPTVLPVSNPKPSSVRRLPDNCWVIWGLMMKHC